MSDDDTIRIKVWSDDDITEIWLLTKEGASLSWQPLVIERPLAKTGVVAVGATLVDPSRYPGRCPRCGAPAYVGALEVDCSRGGVCRWR